jgi:glycosyltransferase involved in cell wall biosynthesis
MKALIVDPALRSMGGHHHSAVRRLQAELARRGIAAYCLGSAYADQRVVQDLACTPVFTRSIYGRSYEQPGEFAQSVEETRRQLAPVLRRKRPDLIIVPCCDQVLAGALARQLASTPRSVRVLAWVLFAPHHLMASDDPRSEPFHSESQAAFGRLAATAGGLHLLCETPAMADFYRRLLGLEVGVVPGPGLRAFQRPSKSAGDAPTVACIGFANRAKGYRLLPEALELVLAKDERARFMIHGVMKGSDDPDRATFDRLARLGARVDVQQNVLRPDEYLARLTEADVLLLPYDPAVYRTRGSGVFSDARTIGIPVVASRGCAFAQPAFDEGWGVEIKEYNGLATGLAVLEALGRLTELSLSAERVAAWMGDALGEMLDATVASCQPGTGRLATVIGRLRPRSA